MRFSIFRTGILTCTVLCAGPAAWAANEDLRQQWYEQDKAAALAGFTAAQKQACIQAFGSRYQSQYTLQEALAFDEPMSQVAYDRLFWKGEGNFRRGLIFTAPVTDRSGRKAGDLLCYFATTENRLDFQSAYVMPGLAEKASVALDESTDHASLVTSSGGE